MRDTGLHSCLTFVTLSAAEFNLEEPAEVMPRAPHHWYDTCSFIILKYRSKVIQINNKASEGRHIMVKKKQEYTLSIIQLKAAKAIAEGEKTQVEIAEDLNINPVTISRWKQEPLFMQTIDQFTLIYARATYAGILREAYTGLRKKSESIEKDKSTHLDYLKTIVALRGYDKGRGHQERLIEESIREKDHYRLSVYDRLQIELAEAEEEK